MSDLLYKCAEFVKWAIAEGPWEGGDLDAASIQDKAEALGLIVAVPYDHSKHGGNDFGIVDGDYPWFEFSADLKAVATPPARANQGEAR